MDSQFFESVALGCSVGPGCARAPSRVSVIAHQTFGLDTMFAQDARALLLWEAQDARALLLCI